MSENEDDVKRQRFAGLVGDLSAGRARLRVIQEDGAVVFDATDYVLGLIRANGGWYEPDFDRSSLFLSKGKKAAREIGEAIHAAHGHVGMLSVYEMIVQILPHGTGRELEMAWNGIGEWRS